MNKRKVTKSKGSKVKANNDPSEVFVLPPNLLEALGINLGNIETVPECTSSNQISDKDLIRKENSGLDTPYNTPEIDFTTSSEKELSAIKTARNNLFSKEKFISQGSLASIPESNYTPSSENESSIIDTANLMKASVFLSPTFISNNRSIIEGEVEILGSDNLMENAMSISNTWSKSEEYDQNDYMIGGVKFTNQHEEVTVSNLNNPKDAKRSEAFKDVNKDVQLTDVHVEINNIEKVVNFDNHADEAYLPYSSNGNVERNDEPDGLNSSVLPPTNNNKKISIISEEIFDPSLFKAFQNSYLDKKKCLIPVEINTLLKSSFSNSNCYQNSIINDCDANVVTYYVEPSASTDSDLRDVNEQKSECEYITDFLLKNELYTENDLINQNGAIDDSLNSHFTQNVSNINEDVIIDTQMKEDSSQHTFKGHGSEYTHLVLSDTLISKEKCDIMETYISDTRNTNTISTNNVEMELNDTLQKVDPNVLDIQNIYINRNFSSTVSDNVTSCAQIQEVSSRHELEVHKDMFDTQFVLADTFNSGDTDKTMETNVEILSEDIKSANTFPTKLIEVKKNASMQKNPNALDEQNCNKVSSKNEDVVIATKKQECSFQQVFEVHEKKLDPQLILLETPDCENNGKIIETNVSDTKTSNKITTNYKKHKINKAFEKIDSSSVNEQNFNVDVKHKKITKTVSDKVNTKLTKTRANHRKTSSDAKRKSGIIFVKDSKINSVSKVNKSHTNVNIDKLNDKVKLVKVTKKVLKRTRRKNTNLETKDMLVKAGAKPTQKSPEELCNSCIVSDDNAKIIQSNNKFPNTSTVDHSIQLGSLGTNNEVQEEKIREIAGYLRKFAELQKLRKKSKDKQNISGNKIFTNKNHATNTKLSIQGVEKPGGADKGKVRESDKNIKTYERKRINKPLVKVSWNTPNYTLTQINISMDGPYNTCKDIDFCLCDDFGRLIYYDDESMYEHIHFWNRKKVDCTPDLLFTIYNENIPVQINNDGGTKISQDYPYENFCAPDGKVNWKETIDNFGFNEDGVFNSHEISLNIDKPNESSIDIQMKPDASEGNGNPEINTENWNKKPKENVSLLENCEETINDNINLDMNTMKNEKKRKYSSAFNGSDEPPVNQYVTESHLEACAKSDKIVKKQKCSGKEPTEKIVPGDQPDSEGSFTISLNKDTSAVCGVCKQHIKDTDWLQHIASQHNYLSWRVDEEPLDFKNRQLLIQHLATLIKQYGVLSCNKCGTTRKYAKPFLHHINQCATVEVYQPQSAISPSELDSTSNPVNQSSNSIYYASVEKQPEPLRLVECGVCGESIEDKDWNSHIGSQHDYLAWKKGEQTLDLDDDDGVKEHLNNIVKECGGLKCAKCGLIRKYVKTYQTHIKSCDGQNVSESLNESSEVFLHIVSEVNDINITVENGAELVADDLVKCGVCGEFMHSKAWNSHIGLQHNYLAWKHGESTLDVDDEVAVKEHLYNILKECGGLKCAKCGLFRKYVKSYLTHVRSCNGLSEAISGCATKSSLDVSEIETMQHASDLISSVNIENDMDMDTSTDVIQCAVCGDSMDHNNWYDHTGFQHNYLAWRCGEPTLDFDDTEATYKHLYAITKEYGGLKCVKCGINRKYVRSYLTHIKSCTGLSDSQIDSTIDESTRINVEQDKMISNTKVTFENEVNDILIKCGVCEHIVQNSKWYNHIGSEHNYLAWKYGEPALDVDDEEAVREHLNNITKEYGVLNCTKCGMTRKYVKSYLTHVKSCSGLSTKDDNPIGDDGTPNIVVLSEAEQHTGLTKCGVCGQYMPLTDWMAHIEAKHNYLAWKDDELPLDMNDQAELRAHLKNIVKEIGTLVCVKCGVQWKFVKSYLQHIEKCDASEGAVNSLKVTDQVIIFPAVGADQVKCGVCHEIVQVSLWMKHITEQHDYLAKKVGETPLDVHDEEQVYKHLYSISKENGVLVCQKCGKERKYVKSYLEHIRKCGQDLSMTGDTTFEANTTPDTSELLVDFHSAGTCGVCDKEVEAGKWIHHIQKEHNYLAWRKGETPLDLDDAEQVYKHLYSISKENGVLVCQKCGKERKYIKSYLEHIRKCSQDLIATADTTFEANTTPDTSARLVDFYSAGTCGVCDKEIEVGKWIQHIEKEHNYLGWRKGETPLDLDDEEQVYKHLYRISKENGVLVCQKCRKERKYVKSYLEHIRKCSQDPSVTGDTTFEANTLDTSERLVDFYSAGTCGVCDKEVEAGKWIQHIQKEHNYLAWRKADSPLDLDDAEQVYKHLYNISKENGVLVCQKCGKERKYIKSYLEHIRKCSQDLNATADTTFEANTTLHTSERLVDFYSAGTCGVCDKEVEAGKWIQHIEKEHNYLAWRKGETSLDLDDEELVYKHLYSISKENGVLVCQKCGKERKYVKSYLEHIRTCSQDLNATADTTFKANTTLGTSERRVDFYSAGTCGVCDKVVEAGKWIYHIQNEHNYLAWRKGEPPLDLDDEEQIHKHLYSISKENGGLVCQKCGKERKYVKSYLEHIRKCDQDLNVTGDTFEANTTLGTSERLVYFYSAGTCGVCDKEVEAGKWIQHIEKEHNYLAWRKGKTPLDLDDEEQVYKHLYSISKENGVLVCQKCGKERKYVKSYLEHIRTCGPDLNVTGDAFEANTTLGTSERLVYFYSAGTCGVCDKEVEAGKWIQHIEKEHNYLAWRKGKTPLDLDDEEQVYKHLYSISKENGVLVCQKCGKERKYVKSYLEHIRTCGQDPSVTGDTTFEANTLDTSECLVDFYSAGTCGVCDKEIEAGKWIQHIQKEHNYLAWRKGETPWNLDDLDDLTQVNEYLYEITKKMGGLTCNKCGLVRKYVKSYLTHIKSCDVVDFNLTSIIPDGVGPVSDKAYRCAMCQKEIEPSDWKNHAMKEHYNITWVIGETPIDIKNPYAVEKYLKEYKQSNSLKCNNCGATRASFAGFYAHVITCGKTEEQIEMFQSLCDICNNKYLCIYKNQHMMIHKVQSYNKEVKMSKEKVESSSSGKRRAAQKARTVIETYSSDMSQHSHKCSTCGFGTDFKEELQSHKCDQNEKDFSEEESSVADGVDTEDESADSEVDSDISREEEDQLQMMRKRYKEPVSGGSKLSKINFKVDDPDQFVEQSDIDFCNAFYTDDILFPKWACCKRETVSEDDLPKYLPPMEQSCQVQAGFDWTTLKRFEAKSGDGTSIFVGACIVCISWVPLRVEDIMGDGQNFLAIACHKDVDCPRSECDETPQHENLIQIWDFGTCEELPRIVYGIAHDFGTVWSMDWCPSGARDALPEDLTDGRPSRLGLLAVACSNGSAYIFSVPHPSTVVENNNFVQKLKPVAEFRMKMLSEGSERKVYQATSVTWSKEKGHETILIGYADGSTGYYYINNNSPLSWRVEDGVDIFFPYNEERPHNTCITATDIAPRLDGGFVACSASATGAEMSLPGAGVRVRSQLPARAAIFAPHWPATLLAGDIAIMSTAANELEWTQPARKLGGVRALAGCARCGRVAAAAPPTLRVMRPHPAYPEFRKQIIGMVEMAPLAKKRNKQVNDELAMKIEPLTYPEVITKYGIQFQSVSKRDKVLQQQCVSKPKAHFPERFPLADVESMAFCPAKPHHDKLAVATHSGIVFFTNVNL